MPSLSPRLIERTVLHIRAAASAPDPRSEERLLQTSVAPCARITPRWHRDRICRPGLSRSGDQHESAGLLRPLVDFRHLGGEPGPDRGDGRYLRRGVAAAAPAG